MPTHYQEKNHEVAYRLLPQTKTRHRAGFTLIETVVALSLMVAAAIGPVALIGKSLATVKFARSKLIAMHLSQEGLEIIRSMRDWNILHGCSGTSWRGGVAPCPGSISNYVLLTPGIYQPDIFSPPSPLSSEPTGESPPISTAAPLFFNAAQGYYTQGSGGVVTPYVRTVIISNSPGGDCGVSSRCMHVVSRVDWNEGGVSRFVETQTDLYNWE